MKIKCPWKGCSGIIDINKDILKTINKKQVAQVSWLIHTIRCPECGNIVGNFDIYPQSWVSLRNDGRIKNYSILNPRTDDNIEFKKDPDLNPFLKKWARIKKKKDRVKTDKAKSE